MLLLYLLLFAIAIIAYAYFTSKSYIISKSIEFRQIRYPSSFLDKLKAWQHLSIIELLKMKNELFSPPLYKLNQALSFDEKSLSAYLFSAVPNQIKGIPLGYDICTDFSYDDMYSFIERNDCFLSMRDVKDIKWEEKGGMFSGSFNVSTSYGFKARCLFKGEWKQITQMVFARKGSDKIEDGYGIFGYDFKENILIPHIDTLIKMKINLPHCDDGEVLTETDPRDIQVDMTKENTLFICRSALTEGLLMSIIRKSQAEYGDCRIFIFADQDCPEDKLKELVDRIKETGQIIYRVYLDSKNKGRFVCVAKKL